MTKRLEITKAFIEALAKSSPQRRKALLKHASSKELKGLFELCLNILRGNLPINRTVFQRLKRHRRIIEDLSNRRIPLYKKRKIINQKGGFLGSLATFALPLLTHILTSALKKRK